MEGKIIYYPIYHDPLYAGAQRSDQVKNWVEKILIPQGRASYERRKTNTILSATGDGGLMHVARKNYNRNPIIVGIGCGSYNFMLNEIFDPNEIPANFNELELISAHLITATFYRKNGQIKNLFAFNDVVIGRDVSEEATFRITGAMKHFHNREVTGSGIIIATPQGSTAYALKASHTSSVVLPLDTNLWIIQGISTGAFPSEPATPQEITVEAVNARYPINGYADGKKQTIRDIVKVIVRPTRHIITLGFVKGTDFHAKRFQRAQEAIYGRIVLRNNISYTKTI